MTEQEGKLPDGWVQCFSNKFHRHYYFENETGKSVWIHPALLKENVRKEPSTISTPKKQPKNANGNKVEKKLTPLISKNIKTLTKAKTQDKKSDVPTKFKNDKKPINKVLATLQPIGKTKGKANKNKTSQQIKKQIADKAEQITTKGEKLSSFDIDEVLTSVSKTSKARYASYKKQLETLKPINKTKNLKNTVKALPKTLPRIPKRIRTLSDSSSIKSTDSGKKELVNPFLKSRIQNNIPNNSPQLKRKPAPLLKSQPRKLSNSSSTSSENVMQNHRNLQRRSSWGELQEKQPLKRLSSESLQNNNSHIFPNEQTLRRHSNENSSISYDQHLSRRASNESNEKQTNILPQDLSAYQPDDEDMRIDNYYPLPETSPSTDFTIQGSVQVNRTNHLFANNDDNENSFEDEEDMEIDNAVGMNREILREIRGIREENIISKPQISTEERHQDLPTYSDPLYIVVDTNILLGHLKFASELKDYPIPGIGAPILVIPWMVFQELDSLKDAVKRYHTQENEDGVKNKSQKLSILARQAINLINSCLKAGHPRVKGQSVFEAGKAVEGFVEESNDDSIIHCCLGLKSRAAHSHVVLLSNDKNLCNKAIITGVKAFQQKTLLMDLRSLFQNAAVAIRQNHSEYDEQAKIEEIMAIRRKQADELSIELQCILREGFAVIIETEMKEAYGDELWLSIVKIQPPWTLSDVLTLLEKHWIAVFGMIVKRSINQTVDLLKKKFHATQGLAGDLNIAKELLEMSLQLFESFTPRSNYNDMLPRCLAGVKVLLKKCEEFIALATPVNGLPPPTPLHALPPSVRIPNSEEESQTTPENGQVNSPHEKVIQMFSAIWRTVNRFSALIFYSLDFPSALTKELDPNEKKPSPQESKDCLLTMTPCLLELIKRLQGVIRVPVDELPHSSQAILNLLQSTQQFMKQVMKQDCEVQPMELLQFCKENKHTLIQGLSQLDRSYATLQQCVEYHQAVR